MILDKSFSEKLRAVLQFNNIEENVPMKNHTSFRVGGPVDFLVTPETFEEVDAVIKLCSEAKVPYFLVGKGSNLLVKDKGIRGVVIKFNKLSEITTEGPYLTAGAGADLKDVSEAALKAKLTGFEFACGIPGSVGGALAMNAGAYHGEMSHVVESALVITKGGKFMTLSNADLELGYRSSAVLKNGYTVLQVTFKLNDGEHEKIKGKIEDLNQKRSDKQPLEYASAGSTFKRPEGHFAAKLIEDSGLKGVSVGDAIVSPKHSGFIINRGNASAEDILMLIELVQKTVKEKYDVDLHTEVRIIGE